MTPLRVGVVGVGHLGQHHARILAAMPGVELVAVADARAEQAQAVAARCGTACFRRLSRRCSTWSTPSRSRCPPSCTAKWPGPFLARGIATLVEKPMAASAAESERLVEDARAGGAVLQVGHIERFNPALRALEQMPIRPKFVSAERLSTYTFRSTDIGVVLDLMIHDLDLLLALVNSPVRSVSAVGVSLFGDHEDVANARIEFEDGSVANVTASRASYTPTRKMRIWGAEGYASLDFAAKKATLVRPSEQLKRGKLDLDGVDLGQPAAVREHLFGKVLRVDKVEPEPLEPSGARAARFRECGPRHFASQGQRRRRPASRPARRPGPPQPRNPPLERRLPRLAGRARFGPARSPRLANQEPPERWPRRPLTSSFPETDAGELGARVASRLEPPNRALEPIKHPGNRRRSVWPLRESTRSNARPLENSKQELIIQRMPLSNAPWGSLHGGLLDDSGPAASATVPGGGAVPGGRD